MSDHDKERLDRLELKLADVLLKLDQNEARLEQIEARIIRQNDVLNRVLSLLGLTLADLEAEDAQSAKPHSLLLLMQRIEN